MLSRCSVKDMNEEGQMVVYGVKKKKSNDYSEHRVTYNCVERRLQVKYTL